MKTVKQVGRRSVGVVLAVLMILSCALSTSGGIIAAAETTSTLFLQPNGGKWADNSTAPKSYSQAPGTIFTPTETPTRSGYTFTGWTFSGTDGSWNGSTYTFGYSTGHLSAMWQRVQTTLTLDPNGGMWSGGSTTSRTVTSGAGDSYVPQQPTRDGYVFQGWTLDGESGEGGTWNGSTYVFGNANRTLTARWQAIPVILTAKPGYGVWAPYTGTQYASALSSEKVYNGTAGSTVDLIVPYSSQYFRISGWTLLPGATGTLTNPMRYQFGTSNDTAAAQFGFDNNTVFLNPSAGSWTNSNTGPASGERYLFFDPDYRMMITVNGAAKPGYRLPGSGDLRRTDYAFAGWTKTSGAGTVVQQGADWYYVFDTTQTGAPMGGAHLIAQWTIRQITLSLQNVERWTPGTQWANSGGTIRVNAGTTVTLPDASCVRYTGCSFTGWYSDNRYHGVLTPAGSPLTSITLHEDTELCAGWAYNTYTITVDPNGGYRTIQTATSSYKNYDSYTVSTVYGYWLRLFDDNSGPLKRDGYRFAGFAPANGAQFAGSIINPAENPNLYNDPNQCYYRIGPTDETLVAQWEKIPQDLISVTIGDQIGVNLLLDLDARGAETVTVVYKDLNGDEQRETFSDFSALPQVEGGLYKIAVQIAPAQIADTVTVYIDGEQLNACVKDYCNALTAGGYSDEVAALAQAVLDYGQAANNFFDYTDETISAVTDLHSDAAKAWTPRLSDTTGKIRSVSFMALTKPEFRFYMRDMTEAEAAALNSRISVSGVNGAAARFVKNLNGAILLEVTGVLAEEMDETITVAIDGLGTITFAGNDFAKLMADNSATEALGAALYAYGEAAKACFRVPTVGDGMEVHVGIPGNMHG